MKLLAIDLETGATLASAPSAGADYGARVVQGEKQVFILGDNGKVTAFPIFSP